MTELMPSLCNDCISRNQCGKDDVKMCVSYIKEIKIRCDDCKFVGECVDYGWGGCRKFTPTPKQPLTHFQRITQTEETLAEWLGENVDYCRTMWYWACDKCDWSKKHESCMNDKEKWLEWLKQESE